MPADQCSLEYVTYSVSCMKGDTYTPKSPKGDLNAEVQSSQFVIGSKGLLLEWCGFVVNVTNPFSIRHPVQRTPVGEVWFVIAETDCTLFLGKQLNELTQLRRISLTFRGLFYRVHCTLKEILRTLQASKC
jgi:hypothetical protein